MSKLEIQNVAWIAGRKRLSKNAFNWTKILLFITLTTKNTKERHEKCKEVRFPTLYEKK